MAVSEDIKAYLIREYHLPPEHIFVTINGIDTDKFSPAVSGERVLREFDRLPFSPGIPSERREEPGNPKRARREARRQMESVPRTGTKAQQALKLQQEEGKLARRTRSRRQREEEKERQFTLREEKRREKHKGH